MITRPGSGVRLEAVRPGPLALARLAEIVDTAQRTDPLAPVTVVVPTNYAGLAVRRTLATRQARAAVSFVTVNRLAEQLAGPLLAGGGRRPVSTPLIAAAVRRVLDTEPGMFAPVAAHPSTERALVRAHRELAGLDETALDTLAAASRRAREVVRIHRAVQALLAPRFTDEHDLLAAAIERAADPAADLTALGEIVVYLPRRLSPAAGRLLATLARRLGVTVLAGTTGESHADALVGAVARALDIEAPPVAGRPPRPTRIVSVSDPDEEIRHAVRLLTGAVHEGVEAARCALLYPTTEPYARLAADALDAAGLPWFGASVRTADISLLGRSLLSMLELADRDLDRRAVFAWLADAPVRWHDQPTPTSAWERLARDAGVTAGRDQWRQRCAARADELIVEADALDADEDDDRRAVARRRDAGRLTELVTFVETLDDTLARLARAGTWRELAESAAGLVDRWFGDETVRATWPDHERHAADAVFAALERLATLDVFDDTPSLAVFRRALETELADDLGRHGRFGRGVLVGPLSLAAGIPLDLAVVVGMAEGSLPARFRDDSLLPDRERRLVPPHLTTRAERTVSQHHDLLSVLAGARESVGLVPRGDLRRTTERAPSRWVLDAVEAVEGERPGGDDLAGTTGDWVNEVPSFVAGIRHLTTPATVQEFDLHLLLLSTEGGADPGRHPLVAQRPELDAAVTSLRSRSSRRFTRFDGNLAAGRPVTIPSPADPERAQAPTRLEAWAACPHAYFVHHLLGVDAVDEPAEEYRISPLTRGSLVHDVLHRWIDECLVAGTVPAPDEPWPAARVERLAALAAASCDEAAERGLTGRRIYWRRDRATIIADLVAFAAHDDAWRRERRARPHAVEWGFGLTGSTHDAVPLALPDGRRVHLRGRVDRLDLADDGTIIVTDYKTGSNPRNYEPSPDDPTAGGTRLQLGLYALAARHLLGRPDAPVRAEYRFVGHRAEFATVGLDVDDAHVAEFLRVVAAIVDGIEAGLFPAHPDEPSRYGRSTCPFCDPDGLGTRERHRLYLIKAADPALRPYLELADPDLLAAVAGTDTGPSRETAP